MKTRRHLRVFLVVVQMIIFTVMISAQVNLSGKWKYTEAGMEMIMLINDNSMVIDGVTYPCKVENNSLMVYEGNTYTPYPFTLSGNQLTLVFPGGMKIVFTREQSQPAASGKLPQSMQRPSSGQAAPGNNQKLTGRWIFSSQQGQLTLEFISADQLSFNGETTRYQLKEGLIQAMGDYGWIDYPYTISQGTLTITFPDGTKIPFTQTTAAANQPPGLNQQGNDQQGAGGGLLWQLKGALCSWSGSSNSSSSYSRTQKIVFDGQGRFQFGSESSFSSNAGIAYGGNPNVQTGRYNVGERTVTLYYQDGTVYEFQVNMRQDNGMITELMYSGTLYAKGLCE